MLDIGAVPTVWNNKYHTVGTAPISNRKTTNTTLSEQFQNLTEKQQIPHCRNNSRQCGISCFSVRYWSCSDSVVIVVFLLDFGIVLIVWYLLFSVWNCSDSVVRTIPKSNRKTTNTTLLEQFQNITEKPQIPHCQNNSKQKTTNTTLSEQFQNLTEFSVRFWNCSDSVVFVVFCLELF
jgi:cytochrome c-type biogenesis protein CcmH/NrfF